VQRDWLIPHLVDLRVNISTKNFPLKAEALRQKLKLKDGGEFTLFGIQNKHEKMSSSCAKNVLNNLPLLIAINKSIRMKRFIFAIVLSFSCVSLFGQVFTGMDEIEKAKKEGFYTYINSEEKYVIESWKKFLKNTDP